MKQRTFRHKKIHTILILIARRKRNLKIKLKDIHTYDIENKKCRLEKKEEEITR